MTIPDLNRRQTQCNVLPNICPQTCIITLGGCSHCVSSCATILGHQNPSGYPMGANNGGSLSYSFLNGGGTPNGGGGSSFLSPNSMNSFSSLSGSSGPANYNPGNLGPGNPYLSSGFGSSAIGTNYNPANPGQTNGGIPFGANSGVFGQQPSGYNGGQLSGLGNQIPGNPANPLSVHTTQAPPTTTTPIRTTATGATQTCRPISCPDIQYVHYINGCPECIIPTSPSSTTTSRPTTTLRATCAPLRCVAPCDKGIGIGPTGCPMCLCK
ncbi:probable glycoprotein hormone G-protein coupled receptor [Saccostrea echinata]|uniref:probable glycoprotein hormone G-protein coupled receptor n=1 Tax=Saccostrea echinata TaxID=191078 RepID=UPI002A7F0058|nr:probable glycoprotein hormone G-protein coupled receptor [Saccostrea echinata]